MAFGRLLDDVTALRGRGLRSRRWWARLNPGRVKGRPVLRQASTRTANLPYAMRFTSKGIDFEPMLASRGSLMSPVFLMGCGQPASTGRDHSQRSAVMGSTREARRAGR